MTKRQPGADQGNMDKNMLDAAQELWASIVDDDECCIGHPEGAEFVEEKIVPKLGKALVLMAQSIRKVALAEAAKYAEEWMGSLDETCGASRNSFAWKEEKRGIEDLADGIRRIDCER